MAAEYVVLRAVHPTYLNLQMPTEVAEVLQYDPTELEQLRPPARGVAFLARGTGVARVVPMLRAGEILPVETAHNRYLAGAHLTERLVFNLPEAVISHLGVKVQVRNAREGRFTDDGLIWFLPAPDYYEFRAHQRGGKGWQGPAAGGMARVYLARSLIPWAAELETIEKRIDTEEWQPRLELLERLTRGRRAGTA